MQFNLQSGEADESTLPWMAYAAFHAGEYEKAADVWSAVACFLTSQAITKMQQREDADPLLHTFLGVCYFYMGKYREAEKLALKGLSTHLLSSDISQFIRPRPGCKCDCCSILHIV